MTWFKCDYYFIVIYGQALVFISLYICEEFSLLCKIYKLLQNANKNAPALPETIAKKLEAAKSNQATTSTTKISTSTGYTPVSLTVKDIFILNIPFNIAHCMFFFRPILFVFKSDFLLMYFYLVLASESSFYTHVQFL